jgi:hypothetical protein
MTAFEIEINHQYQDHTYTILPGLSDDKKSSLFYIFEDAEQVAVLQLFDITDWKDITNSIDEELVMLIAAEIESYFD